MKSLAVKYRPTNFSEVYAQDSICTILKKQIELGHIRNCYLFAGSSGCGKTTVARIFANSVNNNIGLPIEIDAASNNGVENVRSIIATASERSVSSKYKVYIIDEAHALTSQAWQAFLKCIEEPPEYTIFIFCTTDPQKIPATIQNRVMRFNFARIEQKAIYDRLVYICNKEGFTEYEITCDYISKNANGCMRDAISMLDKVASYSSTLSEDALYAALDIISYEISFKLIDALLDGREADVLSIIDTIHKNGKDLKLYIDILIGMCLDIMKYVTFNATGVVSIPSTYEHSIKSVSNFDKAVDYYMYIVNRLQACKAQVKDDPFYKNSIEICLLNICRCK